MEQYKKDLGTQIKLINPVDPAFAVETPENPYRFRTNRKLDAQIEQRLGCTRYYRP
jgi:hypothetical protein